jgi:HSP20 family protein
MVNISHWDPFQEMMRLRQDVDRFLNQWWTLPTSWTGDGSWSSDREFPLALDVIEGEDEFTVVAAIPGANPEELEITLTNNVLTIRGEVKPAQNLVEHGQFRLQERPYGRFVRSLTLPAIVQNNQIQANCENGVLTVHVPKAEQARPKRIAIKTPQAIEG